MSDSIEFNRVPYGDDDSGGGTLLRDYIDELLARLDVDRVRSSCARERALLKVVRGAYEASFNDTEPDRLAELFDDLVKTFGWRESETDILALWLDYWPSLQNCAVEEMPKRMAELRDSDPYLRHGAFWARCEAEGYDSFMHYWGHQASPFAAVVALIEKAAKEVGDE